jgi:hypothetical protein
MVDHKSTTYRPRRAFVEPVIEPVKPKHPARPDHRNGGKSIAPPVVDDEDQKPLYRDETIAPAAVDDEHQKPLYRDETWTNGWSSPASRAAPAPNVDSPTDDTLRSITSTPQRTRRVDEEATAILPRTRPGQHRSQAPFDAIDDYDEDERKPLSRRSKLVLLIGALSMVIVIGLVVGYAVLIAATQSERQPGGTGTSGNASQDPDPTEAAPLTDASLLNADQAELLDRARTWKVELTEQSPSGDAAAGACFGGAPLEGQPTPQQKIMRVLSGGGKNAPKALHEATAYTSPQEAAAAYAIASKTLGGCAVTGLFIQSGHAVSGVGDQAVGVVVMSGTKSRTAHSVVLNRTGRVMNVVDVTQPSRALAITAVAKALGEVNKVQCGPAGGACGGTPSVKDGPPPIGGDVPGFLATGDLPAAGPKPAPWTATEIELPKEEFKGSQCEKSINWATVSAKSKSSRVYLIPDSGTKFFGLNEIVLTTKDAKTAAKTVDNIKSDLAKCEKRVLTATVSKPKRVTGIGAQNTKITGWTATVWHKSTLGKTEFRVGIVSAGPKVIYTFLNPQGDYDFTGGQWDTVAVRAGERATQVD